MTRRNRILVIAAVLLVSIAAVSLYVRNRIVRARYPVITFCGGAREVGGSCLLVEACNARFVVDCGAMGGAGTGVIPPDPATVDFVIVTHAHVDHCGLLPELYEAGFDGRVYCSEPTAELIPIMLRMSRQISREKVSKDCFDAACAGLTRVPFHTAVEEAGGVRFRLGGVEHLLGAAFVEIELQAGGEDITLVVSGDLGSGGSLLLPPLEAPGKADFVVMESTYGGTVRDGLPADPLERHRPFAEAVGNTLRGGGDVLVPAFTLGRTQEVIAAIDRFKSMNVIPPESEVYVDSPTAKKITGVYRKHGKYLSSWARDFYRTGMLESTSLREVKSKTSLRVHERIHRPAIFISSSGDLDYANSPRHLMKMFGSGKNLLCIVGWQKPGSLGSRLLAGQSPVRVRYREGRGFMKDWISPVLQVRRFSSFSGHADRVGLCSWLGSIRGVRRVFLVHGEETAARALAVEIEKEFGIPAEVPGRGERRVLKPAGDRDAPPAPHARSGEGRM